MKIADTSFNNLDTRTTSLPYTTFPLMTHNKSNHRQILLTGTDHCNFSFLKIFSLIKAFVHFFQSCGKSATKSNSKGCILEGLRVSSKPRKNH